MEFVHVPVMLEECVEALNLKEGGIYVDATIGGAGHSSEILKRTKTAKLIGIDQDKDAIAFCTEKLKPYKYRCTLVHDNFSNLPSILEKLKIDEVDGILIDLGVSSYQLDTPLRGFSFRFDAPLDMRMNQENPFSAYDVVNNYTQAQLKQIISNFGEERFASNIARQIVKARSKEPIKTTQDLKKVILAAVPKYRGKDGMDNVQRTFQAIRIEVNGELSIIHQTVMSAISHLKVGGRLAILTFHSLEDRIVKNTFKDLSTNCLCPPEFPVCVCGGNNAVIKVLTPKPVVATKEEIKENSRSASAKLRVAEKIKQNWV